MLRDLLTVIYALALAVVLGGWSAARVSQSFEGFGVLELGQWSAYPDAGTEDADPYARARAALRGELTLGPAEGLRLDAFADTAGDPLSGRCGYVVEGRVPGNRLWTLRITDEDGLPLPSRDAFPTRLHSRAILRRSTDGITIHVSNVPQPGNWLHLDHDGPVRLVLTLYDTALAGATAIADTPMPTVRKIRCRL